MLLLPPHNNVYVILILMMLVVGPCFAQIFSQFINFKYYKSKQLSILNYYLLLYRFFFKKNLGWTNLICG